MLPPFKLMREGMLKSLLEKQSFFKLTFEWADRLRHPEMPSIEDTLKIFVTREVKADILQLSLMHSWSQHCLCVSGIFQESEKWTGAFRNAVLTTGTTWPRVVDCEPTCCVTDILQLFKDNHVLGSWLWRAALGNSTIAKMIEMKVPMRPYAAGSQDGDIWWDTHFKPITDYFYVVRHAHHAKRQAFSKFYYRCFAKAFKNPEGKARKRENDAAEAEWEEAYKRART